MPLPSAVSCILLGIFRGAENVLPPLVERTNSGPLVLIQATSTFPAGSVAITGMPKSESTDAAPRSSTADAVGAGGATRVMVAVAATLFSVTDVALSRTVPTLAALAGEV